MDTQNLRAFLAVANCRSFSGAAEQLHITQPAVSKRISMLEQELDTRLFDRIGRTVSLTEAGRTLHPFGTRIINDLREARQAVQDLEQSVKGELRLVTSHHIGLHRLPSVLREFSKRFPKVNPFIEFQDSEAAQQLVLSGEFDLGIVTRSFAMDEHIENISIWDDPLQFVVAIDHPLAEKQNLQLEDLCAYPALLPEQRFLTTRLVTDLFRSNKLELKINMSTNYLETIKALISVGYGWGVLPETMLQDRNVVPLQIDGIQLTRKLDCILHRNRQLSNPTKQFLALLTAEE